MKVSRKNIPPPATIVNTIAPSDITTTTTTPPEVVFNGWPAYHHALESLNSIRSLTLDEADSTAPVVDNTPDEVGQ